MIFHFCKRTNAQIKVYSPNKRIGLHILEQWISARNNRYVLAFHRAVVYVVLHPLQVSVEPNIKKRAAIFSRCNPLVAVLGIHGRVATHETPRTQLVAVAIQLENVGRTPCQTQVGSQRQLVGGMVMAAYAVSEIRESTMSAIVVARPVVACCLRILPIETNACLCSEPVALVLLESVSP